MTARREPDRIVGAFLLDGPTELSPRLLQAIRDDVHRTDQRSFRRPWRTPSMPRSLLILVPLGAVLLLVGALALGGGGRNTATPAPASPAASTAASTAVAASSSPAPSAVATPYPIAAREPWIAAVDGPVGVFLIRPDGSGYHSLLPADDALQNSPDWSPDGSQLVFERDHGFSSQLWVMNADGTGGRAVTPLDDACAGACPFTTMPRWSRDGRSIAYIETIVDVSRPISNAVKIVDVATGTTHSVYESATELLSGPSWSPDGTQLVISTEHYPQLATSRLDGMAPTATTLALLDLTSPSAVPQPIPGVPAFAGRPDWSPDGRLIVFRTNPFINGAPADPTAGTTIATIAPSGGPVTILMSKLAGEPMLRGPSWTPDGRSIIYAMLGDGTDVGVNSENLRIADADGSYSRSVTGGVGTGGSDPRLRPTP